MDNPDTQATLNTWNEDKQDKNTAQKSKTMNNTEPTK